MSNTERDLLPNKVDDTEQCRGYAPRGNHAHHYTTTSQLSSWQQQQYVDVSDPRASNNNNKQQQQHDNEKNTILGLGLLML